MKDPVAMNSTSSHVNRNGEIISVTVIFTSLSLTALCLRLLSRRLKRVNLHYDDYLIIAAWVCLQKSRQGVSTHKL